MDNLLDELLKVPSPSRFKENAQSVFKEAIASYVDSIETDALGNVIAMRQGPEGSHKVMFSAHCDEVGFLVSSVDEQGYLYVQEVGGVDTDLLPGRKVCIHTAHGVELGVFGKKANRDLEKGERMRLEMVE